MRLTKTLSGLTGHLLHKGGHEALIAATNQTEEVLFELPKLVVSEEDDDVSDDDEDAMSDEEDGGGRNRERARAEAEEAGDGIDAIVVGDIEGSDGGGSKGGRNGDGGVSGSRPRSSDIRGGMKGAGSVGGAGTSGSGGCGGR